MVLINLLLFSKSYFPTYPHSTWVIYLMQITSPWYTQLQSTQLLCMFNQNLKSKNTDSVLFLPIHFCPLCISESGQINWRLGGGGTSGIKWHEIQIWYLKHLNIDMKGNGDQSSGQIEIVTLSVWLWKTKSDYLCSTGDIGSLSILSWQHSNHLVRKKDNISPALFPIHS